MLNALTVLKMSRFRLWTRSKRIRKPDRVGAIISFENYSWLNERNETIS
jgi:hypothetical protein